MSSKIEKDKTKQLQDKCQTVLNDLLRDEDNKYCVDCDSKGPRWASWNIGVFLCIRCAGIHRNLGVHISKVKSVNLDTWTPEQVVSLQQMGNSRARAVYEANLPDNFRRPQNDSSLESFIRAKYEHKKYIAREWVPPQLPKVNWEKEIEDELEKQKRKKKSTLADSDKKTLVNSVDVPQIPKPKNPSPKPNRNTTPDIKKKENGDSDLLGLQNGGEDNFSGFLSATSEKKSETVSIKSEEESFFNQTIPVEKEKVKLTKDSILALYGSGPQQNVSTNQFNQYHMGQQTYQSGNFATNFNAFQQAPQFQQQQQQQYNNAGWQQQQSQHQQQWTKNGQIQAQFLQQQQQQPQYISPNSALMPNYGQFPQQLQQQQQFNQTPNPFYVNQGNLQQQFNNLSINNTNTSSVSTNIWQ